MPKRKSTISRTTAQAKRFRLKRFRETPEDRQARLGDNRDRNSQRRSEQTPDYRAARLEHARLRDSQARQAETPEQREARLQRLRVSESLAREAESGEEREARLERLRVSVSLARKSESLEEREVRFKVNCANASRIRQTETPAQRETRLAADRAQHAHRTQLRWATKERSGFSYDPNNIDYAGDSSVDLGAFNKVCTHCNAVTWKDESKGICCSSGKIKLPDVADPPEPLLSLITGRHPSSKTFLSEMRRYNSAFQMTSFGANIITDGQFLPTFKVKGQVYHLAGSLLPSLPNDHKFLQIYFVGDHHEQATVRCNRIPNLDFNLVSSLQGMLHEHNTIVRSFLTAVEQAPPNENFEVVIYADKTPAGQHRGRYNAPTTDEVAVIISGQEFGRRDIVLHSRDGGALKRISELHRSYDALQYPLMFCRGEDGYSIAIPQVDPVTRAPQFDPITGVSHKTVSSMSFYAYRIMVKIDNLNILHRFGALFNQFLVDMYAKIETERLMFLKNNQKQLRAEEYIHLQDAIRTDGNLNNLGRLFILPSSFTGSPRYMHEKNQDAMTYVRHYGRPDLFITLTCNPNWTEITSNLLFGQKAHNRHDIVARVFHLKVKKFMDLLRKEKLFGTVRCFMYTVEWQKRGLPHTHTLVWLQNKIRANEIDSVISAELPSVTEDPELHELVKKHMMHGPCGRLNESSPCMKSGRCTKRYPKAFISQTRTDTDGYPTYRRRRPEEGGTTATRGSIQLDNRWVVPFNPVLLRTFNAHINVELCSSVKSIKYICKYVNKGSDQATYAIENQQDEILIFQSGRYISSSEAVWRILSFDIHERDPTVIHLAVHLENGQRVYFTAANAQQVAQNPKESTLTAFFKLCAVDPFAAALYYNEVPSFYTWSRNKFRRRRQGTPVDGHPGVFKSTALGRVYTVHPNNAECYYLRMLLHSIRGPTSFESLRTVNGVVHERYQAACRDMGLLEDETHWSETLTDAAVSTSPTSLRDLFCIMIVFCNLSDPMALWNTHRDDLSEDVLQRIRRLHPAIQVDYSDDIYNEALVLLNNKVLSLCGKSIKNFGLPEPQQAGDTTNLEYIRETTYNAAELAQYTGENEPKLTAEQKRIFLKILDSVEHNSGKGFFLDAPGGTGKTFLINLLLSKVRSLKKIAIAVASSGIAATLLQGGKTAHATFKLPLDMHYNDSPVCNISKQSGTGKLLQNCALIVWDECTMSNKVAAEALNRSLQDLRSNNLFMGGVTVIFSGDFRQTLPVVPRGTRADEVNACLKKSVLWSEIESLSLTRNMRVHLFGDQLAGEFANILLKIGNATLPSTNGKIKLESSFCNEVPTVGQLIEKVYPDLPNLSGRDSSWLCERAILVSRNDRAADINKAILQQVTGERRTYNSVDTVVDVDEAVNYPVEFLNSLNPSGIPSHELTLKVGAPIILLRNLNPPTLCNGTRLRIISLKLNVIEAAVITGCAAGDNVFIPRIPMIPSDYPFRFKRLQFPVKICFAITINKAQGQTLKVTGVDLQNECFSHGQLYVACSRVSSHTNLFIHAPQSKTTNIVYQEVLR